MSEAKTCPQCSTTITRTPDQTDGSWIQQTYCSRICGVRARRNGARTVRKHEPPPWTPRDDYNLRSLQRYWDRRYDRLQRKARMEATG